MLQKPKETIKTMVPSPKPLYVVAVVWVIGTLFLKMYKLSSYLILGAISLAAYFISRKFLFPDEEKVVEVETKRTYFSQLQQEFIESGTKSLNSIIEINKKIDKPELNADVNELVATTDKILDYVYEHEQSAGSMRKLVNYYLPTVEKLLTRYDEIEEQEGVANVDDAKKKVEDIIKTTAVAFKNQLNSLYDTDTLDVNSEVKVLEQIYAREGLIDLEGIEACREQKGVDLPECLRPVPRGMRRFPEGVPIRDLVTLRGIRPGTVIEPLPQTICPQDLRYPEERLRVDPMRLRLPNVETPGERFVLYLPAVQDLRRKLRFDVLFDDFEHGEQDRVLVGAISLPYRLFPSFLGAHLSGLRWAS